MFAVRGRMPAGSVRRWSDLRLWCGLGLILVSMFAGAYLLSADDQSVIVWRAATDLAVGDVPQLEAVSVRLDDSAAAYLPASEHPVGRMRLPVQAGALVPAAAVGAAEPSRNRLVTVPVDALHAPVALSAGDVVDVWVTSDDDANPKPPNLVLAQAHVHAVDHENLGVAGELPVVLEVQSDQTAPLIAASRGRIALVEVPLSAQSTKSQAGA